LLLGEATCAASNRDARGEALHIPLKGPGKGLVEVVEIEHQLARGCVIPAEIPQVCVAAEFDLQVCPGTGRDLGVSLQGNGFAPRPPRGIATGGRGPQVSRFKLEGAALSGHGALAGTLARWLDDARPASQRQGPASRTRPEPLTP